MAGAKKSVLPLAMLIIVVLVAHSHFITKAKAQTCSSSLANLNVCTPFLVPGAATTPSTDCCTALQGVGQDCLCGTLAIASRVRTQCNLPALSCDAN